MHEKPYNDKLYKIVFDGEIMEGYVLDEVKKKLSGIFKWNQDKIDELFSVIPLEIADNIDYQTAITYKAPFDRAGAVCKIYHPEKGLIIEKDKPTSPILNYQEINHTQKSFSSQYDFGQSENPEFIDNKAFNKDNVSYMGIEGKKETEQNQTIAIKTNLESNIPNRLESKELLGKQKDEHYAYFSNIYKQAKKKTAGKTFKLIIYLLIGMFFFLTFMIPMVATMRGLYVIGITGGFLMALMACIIMYPINHKINKNRSLKTASYFKQHISIENPNDPSFFLAALILWADRIQDSDPAKDEMLSVSNEIASANTMDHEKLQKYLKEIGNVDNRISI